MSHLPEFFAGVLAILIGVCTPFVLAAIILPFAPPAVALSLTVVILALAMGLLLAWASGLFDAPQIPKDLAAALEASEREFAERMREEAEQMAAERERLRYVRFEPRYGGQVVGVTHEEELARIERQLRRLAL